MKSWKRIAWIAAAFAPPVIWGQTSDGASPPTSGVDAAFVRQALQDQTAEIELSKIAQNNSTNPEIIDFAKATARDETQANQVLRELATKKGIRVSPAPDAEHAAMARILGCKNGTQLDAYYAEDMTRIDDKMIQLYRAESADHDRDIAAYAQSTLPQEERHEKRAQSLTGSAAQQAT